MPRVGKGGNSTWSWILVGLKTNVEGKVGSESWGADSNEEALGEMGVEDEGKEPKIMGEEWEADTRGVLEDS